MLSSLLFSLLFPRHELPSPTPNPNPSPQFVLYHQEELCLSVVYFLCCPGASVLQMVMEMEEREPGVMTWEGFIRAANFQDSPPPPGLAGGGEGEYTRMGS